MPSEGERLDVLYRKLIADIDRAHAEWLRAEAELKRANIALTEFHANS